MKKSQYPIGFELIKTDMRRLIFAVAFGFSCAFLMFSPLMKHINNSSYNAIIISVAFLVTAALLGNSFKQLLNHIYQWNKKAYRQSRKSK